MIGKQLLLNKGVKMKDMLIRPVTPDDEKEIKEWHEESNVNVELELPHGFVGVATETAIAENALREKVASLTGTIAGVAIVLDPLIKNPKAKKIDVFNAILQMGRALEFYAGLRGAVESYVAVPNSLPGFQAILERIGYEETAQDCKLYRRLLYSPDSRSLGTEAGTNENNN